MQKIVATLWTAALVFSTNVIAVNPNSGQTSTSQTLNIEITSPIGGADIDITQALSVEGRVNIGNVPSTGRSNVAFVIDVSGSTTSSGNDCNNDGQSDMGDNFTPVDSGNGTVLDCEIGAVMALNDSLGSDASVSTAVVVFGSSAATALDFVSPPDVDSNGDGMSDVDDVLVQIDQASNGAGFGTDFNDALIELTRLMNTRPSSEQRVAYFLTDGASTSNVTASATAARDAGIRVETFSVGDGAEPCEGSPLGQIASITGGSCTDVQDVDTLAAVISGVGGVPPTGIDRVTLSINGAGSNVVEVDNLGNWQGTIAALDLASGVNTLEATVFAQDGTAVVADLMVNSLGDSTPTTPDTPEPPTVPDTPTVPEVPSTPTVPDTPVSPPVLPMMMGPMICANGAASDHDGDGWGWENNSSCLVQGSAFDLARQTVAHCELDDSDSDGDGWGWENNATCIVPGSAASLLID